MKKQTGIRKKCLNIGGQAVIEGVMIRSDNVYSVCVRKENGKISVKKDFIPMPKKIFTLPFIRGIYKLSEMLKIAIDALTWSGNEAYNEKEELSKKDIAVIIASSVFISIIFFALLPYVITSIGISEIKNPLLFNLIDGIIKIVILIAYILIISRMEDIKRIFQYHGAEHKAVNCYENGQKLTLANIKKYSTIHTRCGTNFLMLTFIISVFAFSLIPLAMTGNPEFSKQSLILQKILLFIIRLVLIPVIAGISYEFLKISSKYIHIPIFKAISFPGLLLQRLTTSEPSDSQIEVAKSAVNAVLKTNQNKYSVRI
ncbi:MAG: DUF1385 domain-containing protein [archaeon]